MLLDISDSGRLQILDELTGRAPDDPASRERYACVLIPELSGARIPAIVRREEVSERPGLIPVGFSSLGRSSEGRLRIAAFARPEDIVGTSTPYELLTESARTPRNACTTALEIARRYARSLGLVLGVWGSVAMELYTGYPCTHENSDLDLLVKSAPLDALSAFLSKVESIEAHLNLRVDVELDLDSGYGVHLKELLGSQGTVIGKGLADVVMLSCMEILAGLPQASSMPGTSHEERGMYG